jgi:hypothetical protein
MMSWRTCSTHREKRNGYKNLKRKIPGKGTTFLIMWEHDFKMDLREISCEVSAWIKLDHIETIGQVL